MRDLTLARFREELKHANELGRRYTVNFARGPLFGRGPGHHSTVGVTSRIAIWCRFST